ncbi:MAG: hypothetical protein AAGB04_22225, partial [Pseudomonadota bacterium]
MSASDSDNIFFRIILPAFIDSCFDLVFLIKASLNRLRISLQKPLHSVDIFLLLQLARDQDELRCLLLSQCLDDALEAHRYRLQEFDQALRQEQAAQFILIASQLKQQEYIDA